MQQDDLLAALVAGTLAGAGLDVLDLSSDSGRALLALDNVVCTPHIGFNTQEAATALTAIATDNVVRFLDGEPCNVVNPEAL